MKIKYPGSKLVLLSTAMVATPAIALGLLWQAGGAAVKPELTEPVAQVSEPPAAEPLIIRVIVVRSPSGSYETR